MSNPNGFTRRDYLAATPELHTGESEEACHCGADENGSGYCEQCPTDCKLGKCGW